MIIWTFFGRAVSAAVPLACLVTSGKHLCTWSSSKNLLKKRHWVILTENLRGHCVRWGWSQWLVQKIWYSPSSWELCPIVLSRAVGRAASQGRHTDQLSSLAGLLRTGQGSEPSSDTGHALNKWGLQQPRRWFIVWKFWGVSQALRSSLRPSSAQLGLCYIVFSSLT